VGSLLFAGGGEGRLSDNARDAPLVAVKCALQADIAKLIVTEMRHHLAFVFAFAGVEGLACDLVDQTAKRDAIGDGVGADVEVLCFGRGLIGHDVLLIFQKVVFC
jgi:hypothetical protein